MILVIIASPKQAVLLVVHIKSVHTKESKYECKVCEKMFSDRRKLLQPVKAVHYKIKSFVCTECDKMFTQSSNVTAQMRIHKKEKTVSMLIM